MELDDTKVNEEDIREENSIQLKVISEKIFQSIISSTNTIPNQFYEIFVFVKSEINKKFKDDEDALYNAVSGLFFLRFVIPSIFAPHFYGLLNDPPTPTSQRQLILISKVLQSIANMSLPGNKEPFMQSMHGYIEKKIPVVKSFYDELSKTRSNPNADALSVPKNMKKNAIATLWNLFYSKSEKVKEKLSDENHKDHYEQVKALLDKYFYAEKDD